MANQQSGLRRGVESMLPQSTLGLVVLSTAAALALALVAALIASQLLDDGEPAAAFSGTQLNGAPAPDFILTDEHGQDVSLSDFRGKTVLLSFMFTQCPDVCPLMANKIAATLGHLGTDAGGVQVLLVSIDPANDTPENIAAFYEAHGLDDADTAFVSGEQDDLDAVYRAYGIGTDHAGTHADASATSHTDAVYLIDAEGNSRALLRSDFREADLLNDIQIVSE